jgi:hypothetical protein
MAILERGKVKDGAIELERPLALPDGTVVEVRVQPKATAEPGYRLEEEPLVEDISTLPFVGMWKDRADMADSVEWVSNQRDQWNRYRDPAES